MARIRFALPLALVLALATCGSSGGSTSAGTSSTTRRGSDADPTLARDRQLARRAIIRPSDLPAFTATPRTGEGEEKLQDLAAGVPGCEQLIAGKRDGRVHLRSPRFTHGQVTIDEDVSVYRSPAEMTAQLEVYRQPSIIGCLQALFTKAIQARVPPGTTIQDVSVSPIAVEDVGDGQFGFRLTVQLTENGTPQTLLSDIVGVAVGRVGVSLTAMASETADLAQAESHLVPLIARRVEHAEG
jgi:hypothetical protein